MGRFVKHFCGISAAGSSNPLVDAGKVRPLVYAERFSFAEVGKAHALLQAGGALGKIVLTW